MIRLSIKKYPFITTCMVVLALNSLIGLAVVLFLSTESNRALERTNSRYAYLQSVVLLNDCVIRSVTYNTAVLHYCFDAVPHAKTDAAMERAGLEKSVAQAKKFSQSNSEQRALFDRLQQTLGRIASMQESYPGGIEALKDEIYPNKLRLSVWFFKNTAAFLHDTLSDFEQTRMAFCRANSSESASYRMQGSAALAGVCVALVALAVFLFVFYFGFRRRLAILAINCRRLATRSGKLSDLPSRDEFSALNGLLIAIDQALYQAAAFRSFMVSMITHDMRSPLAAAAINLQVIAASQSSTVLSARSAGLTSAIETLGGCAALIADLLMIEKARLPEAEEEVLLSDLVSVVVDQIEEDARKNGVNLHCRIGADIVSTREQLLQNTLRCFLLHLFSILPSGANLALSAKSTIGAGTALSVTITLQDGVTANALSECLPLSEGSSTPNLVKWYLSRSYAALLGAHFTTNEQPEENQFVVNLILSAQGKEGHPEIPASPTAWGSGSVAETGTAATAEVQLLKAERSQRPVVGASLLLLALPAVAQMMLFLYVFGQLESTEKVFSFINRQINALLVVNSLELGDIEAGARAILFTASPTSRHQAESVASLKRDIAFLDEVDQLAGALNGIAPLAGSLRALKMEEVDALQKSGNPAATDTAASVRIFEKKESALGQRFRDLVKLESSRLDRLMTQTNFGRKRFDTLVNSIMITDFLAVVLGVVLFYRYSDRRFSEMVRATHGLAASRAADRKRILDEFSVVEEAVAWAQRQLIESEAESNRLLLLAVEALERPIKESLQQIKDLREDCNQMFPTRDLEMLDNACRSLRVVLVLIAEMTVIRDLSGDSLRLVRKPSEVSEIVREVGLVLDSLLQKKRIDLNMSLSRRELLVDRDKIFQVLMNVISNAIKFSPVDSKIQIDSGEQGGFYLLSVQDSGGGIDKKDLPKLFDRFFQANSTEKNKGFGVGLAVTKVIMEAHGGSVEVQSQTGKGSTFILRLPLNLTVEDT